MKEHRKKVQVLSFLLSVAVTIVGILILILSSTLFKNWIIIVFNVRALKWVNLIGAIIIIVGIISIGICSIPLIKARLAEKRRQEQELTRKQQKNQIMAEYAGNIENPDSTRKRLEQIREETPELDVLIGRCLNQMDRMDILQEKQNLLITGNDALYLQDTVGVFNNVERRLCRNFRNIINLCIAADTAECVDMAAVEKNLTDNEKKLNDTKELLKVSADWINQYDGQSNSDRSELENWIAVIRDSLKED